MNGADHTGIDVVFPQVPQGRQRQALRCVATIESIGSSTRIEGSKLFDREVEQLLSNLEISLSLPATSRRWLAMPR